MCIPICPLDYNCCLFFGIFIIDCFCFFFNFTCEFVCDFEFPLRKAVDASWIGNNGQCIQGEEFHFKKALIKQINQKGLQHFYQNKINDNCT